MSKRQNNKYRSIAIAVFASIVTLAQTGATYALNQTIENNSTPIVSTPSIIKNNTDVASLGVFQSVAISAARLPAASKWQDATRRDYRPFFTAACADAGLTHCDTPFARKVQTARRNAMRFTGPALLQAVNRSINFALPYRSDRQVWGEADHWATMPELATRGVGDCEDYAIAKYWMLRSLGFPAEKLQLVVLADTRRQEFHAVLVAHYDGTSYVLDNLSSMLRTDTSIRNYMPIMSFAGGKSYIHGFTNQTTAVAVNLSTVAPGQGF